MKQSIQHTVSIWLTLTILATAIGIAPRSRAATTSVTIAGSLQSELGCPGDWDPACSATHLLYDAADDVWQRSFSVPAGNWEYKAAINDSWDENYGASGMPNGSNIPLSLAAAGAVKFYFDDKSKWITDNLNARIVTAPGSFQSELGCSGDWQPDCLRSWLQDIDGDGVFTFTTSALPMGNYEVKAAIGEAWDENYGLGGAQNGSNISFAVSANYLPVHFSFASSSNVLTVRVGQLDVPEPGTLVLVGLGLVIAAASRKRL